MDANTSSYEEKQKAIVSLMFLTEKQDGSIKAQACADGQKLRAHIEKINSASPMVMSESIFTTAAIDAKEEREVAIFDLLGYYIHKMMRRWSYKQETC